MFCLHRWRDKSSWSKYDSEPIILTAWPDNERSIGFRTTQLLEGISDRCGIIPVRLICEVVKTGLYGNFNNAHNKPSSPFAGTLEKFFTPSNR
jgi:hypothetical protein